MAKEKDIKRGVRITGERKRYGERGGGGGGGGETDR